MLDIQAKHIRSVLAAVPRMTTRLAGADRSPSLGNPVCNSSTNTLVAERYLCRTILHLHWHIVTQCHRGWRKTDVNPLSTLVITPSPGVSDVA